MARILPQLPLDYLDAGPGWSDAEWKTIKGLPVNADIKDVEVILVGHKSSSSIKLLRLSEVRCFPGTDLNIVRRRMHLGLREDV